MTNSPVEVENNTFIIFLDHYLKKDCDTGTASHYLTLFPVPGAFI